MVFDPVEGFPSHETVVPVRVRLCVRGRVQGVGFRPFVFRLARELGLGGWVGNDGRGVFVEAEGAAAGVEEFVARLVAEAPALARVDGVESEAIRPLGETAFRIVASEGGGVAKAQVTPDAATCGDCLRELLDPADRRFRYPFINCTNCGPRYSIVEAVPYDRPNTTMRAFTMCPDCEREYGAAADRRFHAQPNACPVCGPRVWLVDRAGVPFAGDPVGEAAVRLLRGEIVAVKGLGGFHLACRADRDEPVAALRERKGRDAKPFAVMTGDLDMARGLCDFNSTGEALFVSSSAPIVVSRRRTDAAVSALVAPGSDTLGVMLAYTPLHRLLFAEGLPPLVMTSGNPSEEPLCHDNGEALARLGHIADAFLMHDREIAHPLDDSVVLAAGSADGQGVVVLRRARGYVPGAIGVAPLAPRTVLALGGELKSTVCFLRGGEAILSEHLGDLSNPSAYRNFVEAIDRLGGLLRIRPEILACDLHPGYASTRHARARAAEPVFVQHHHAHIAAVMAEHGIEKPVVGIAADGTGYGTDGTIWGCEILVTDLADFERVGHLERSVLPGGDAAAREGWRAAAGWMDRVFGSRWRAEAGAHFAGVDPTALDIVAAQLERHRAGVRVFPVGLHTSSLGRLFDSVAFLLGICHNNLFEAQAAMRLETVAANAGGGEVAPLPFDLSDDVPLRMDPSPAIREIVERRRCGEPAATLARAFHEMVAAMLTAGAVRAAARAGIGTVALSGGCFANRLLSSSVAHRLKEAGLKAVLHRQAPPGDGGVALGQAVVAAARDRLGLVGDLASPREK